MSKQEIVVGQQYGAVVVVGYDPGNCRWATAQQQAANQRHHFGEVIPTQVYWLLNDGGFDVATVAAALGTGRQTVRRLAARGMALLTDAGREAIRAAAGAGTSTGAA